MSNLRQTGRPIFTSSRDVVIYYTTLIDGLIPQLRDITCDDYQTIQADIADLRRELAEQIKNFGHDYVNDYFNEAMASAESDQEYYKLSNAYETILRTELTRIKEQLHILKTT